MENSCKVQDDAQAIAVTRLNEKKPSIGAVKQLLPECCKLLKFRVVNGSICASPNPKNDLKPKPFPKESKS